MNVLKKLITQMKNKWKAVYIERCTYGFGARLWKPIMET